jgi:hypothetical protein
MLRINNVGALMFHRDIFELFCQTFLLKSIPTTCPSLV